MSTATIEIQHFDGTVEELEPEGWIALRAELTAAPEDWSGSVDVNYEDLPGAMHLSCNDWQSELDQLDDVDFPELD